MLPSNNEFVAFNASLVSLNLENASNFKAFFADSEFSKYFPTSSTF